MERQTVLKALVGSHNYNLNTPESDKDYKVFVLPTFEDLYKGKVYSSQVITETEDLNIHDVRKLSDLFFKSNINFIEVLYSKEVTIPSGVSAYQEKLIGQLLSYREEIVRMNLPYLYNACIGMHKNKMGNLVKGTDGTKELVEAYGYDTKQALHAYRVLNFLERFEQTDFNNFEGAMRYSDTERHFLLSIKDGFYGTEKFVNLMDLYQESISKLKEKYHSATPNEELKEVIESIVMKIVKDSVVNSH